MSRWSSLGITLLCIKPHFVLDSYKNSAAYFKKLELQTRFLLCTLPAREIQTNLNPKDFLFSFMPPHDNRNRICVIILRSNKVTTERGKSSFVCHKISIHFWNVYAKESREVDTEEVAVEKSLLMQKGLLANSIVKEIIDRRKLKSFWVVFPGIVKNILLLSIKLKRWNFL